MWSSPLFWIVVAVLVFWGLGAYNRLARLRSAVLQRETALMQEISSCIGIFDELHAKIGQEDSLWQQDSLQSLAQAVAFLRPFMQPEALQTLKSERLHAIATALHALKVCAVPIVQLDVAMHPAPWTMWQLRWTDLADRIAPVSSQLQIALVQYNAALEQFPASLLAKICGFSALHVNILSTDDHLNAKP